jgi:hypothetical protein
VFVVGPLFLSLEVSSCRRAALGAQLPLVLESRA